MRTAVLLAITVVAFFALGILLHFETIERESLLAIRAEVARLNSAVNGMAGNVVDTQGELEGLAVDVAVLRVQMDIGGCECPAVEVHVTTEVDCRQ